MVANVRPKPMRKRAPMNILTVCDAVWRATPPHMMIAPIMTVGRRPMPSETYGANGYAARDPMFYFGKDYVSGKYQKKTEAKERGASIWNLVLPPSIWVELGGKGAVNEWERTHLNGIEETEHAAVGVVER